MTKEQAIARLNDCLNIMKETYFTEALKMSIKALEEERGEGVWIYCPDDEHRPRWRCSCCGKIVHRDPAEKLYCSHCGQRNRKEA